MYLTIKKIKVTVAFSLRFSDFVLHCQDLLMCEHYHLQTSFLCNLLVNQNQFLCGASMGIGIEQWL